MDSPIRYCKRYAMCIPGETHTERQMSFSESCLVTPSNLFVCTEVRVKYEPIRHCSMCVLLAAGTFADGQMAVSEAQMGVVKYSSG